MHWSIFDTVEEFSNLNNLLKFISQTKSDKLSFDELC